MAEAIARGLLTGGVFWAAKRVSQTVPEHAASVTSPASPDENALFETLDRALRA